MAKIDKSDCVLIDEADVLDKPGRDGLFSMLAAHTVCAVVGMTMNKPQQLPNLAGAGLGTAYWIERGTVKTREEALAPVALAAE
jgi:hypothetical protein